MLDLSIVLPAQENADTLAQLLPRVAETIARLGVAYEILIVEHAPDAATHTLVTDSPYAVRLLPSGQPGFGSALRTGFAAAAGAYIITLAADLSDDPTFIATLWQTRHQGEIVIGSRYMPGGSAQMSLVRWGFSRLLNAIFCWGLSLPVHDLSSGYRVYQANILPGLKLDSRDYDILEEILIKGYAAGWRLREVPCHYQAKGLGRSPGNLLRLARAYLSTMGRMWRLRNSVDCADYDYRAHDSLIPLQRYWQRRRHHLVLNMVDWSGRTLDIGCGSSHILADLGSVIGLDIRLNKLRYGRRFGQPLVQGSIWELPFPDNSFECVLCSEVIEHIAAGDKPFLEMRRVLKPGGRLVLGTPDYGHRTWRIIEALYRLAAPGGYADEHITQYSRASLINKVESFSFRVEQVAYVLHSELILKCTYVGGPPLDGADLAESGSKLAVVTPVIS